MKKTLIATGVAFLALASVASAATFSRNLTVGSSGADVTALQTTLIAGGYAIPAGATGYFGSQTQKAVKEYQVAKGIVNPGTGFVGPLTLKVLNGGAAVASVDMTACPSWATCTAKATGVTGSASTGSITTPGVEGILTITQGPISNTVVNVGAHMVPVLAVRAQAQNSDIAVQRITLDLGTDTKIYNKIFTQLYVLDSSGAVLATIPLNSSTVVQSGSNYVVTASGFNTVVSKNSYKDFTIAADLYSAIDSSNLSGSYPVSIDAFGVRGVDGAGINQTGPSAGTITQSVTINSSLTDNAIANISTDSTSPQTNSVPVTDTTYGQYLKLPVLIFNVGAQNDTLHLHQVQVDFTGVPTLNTGTTSAAYLFQGATQISSASIIGTGANTGSAVFNNIVDGTAGASIPVNTNLPFTVKVDVTGVTAGTLAITPSLNVANTVIYNSQDSTVTGSKKNGIAPGFVTTVLGKGPAFALAGTPTISVSGSNQSGSTNSTSTIIATFNLNVQAIGSNVFFGNQASSTHPMFVFKVFNGAGTDVTSSVTAKSSGFIIPSAGVITVGVPSGSFYVPQQNSAQIGNVTFQFAGKDASGNVLNAGPYSVEIAGISYSVDGGATTATSTYMDGLSAWRTSGINP